MKKFLEMGVYYSASPYGLIRSVCKAFDAKTKEPKVAFVEVNSAGIAGDILLLPEQEFKEIFLK